MQMKCAKKNIVSLVLILCTLWLGTASAFAETPAWAETAGRAYTPAAGITNYISPDGTISAEVGKGITWICDQRGESDTWYGIDNSSDVFRSGSRFYIRWIDEAGYPEEFERYFGQLDAKAKSQLNSAQCSLLLFGVEDPDGNRDMALDDLSMLYVQFGEIFDADTVRYMSMASESMSTVARMMQYPAGEDRFAALSFIHFGDCLLVPRGNLFPASVLSKGNPVILCASGAAVVLAFALAVKVRKKKKSC